MRIIKNITYPVFFAALLSSTAQADESPLAGIKLGFGHDLGFGMTGQIGNFNGFIGNDGVAVDYIFVREKIEAEIPVHWYIAAGGFVNWRGDDTDLGARTPVGVDVNFAKGWDIYAQIIPELEIVQEFEFDLDGAIGVRYQF